MARIISHICNTIQKANKHGPRNFLSLLSYIFINTGRFPIQQAQERIKEPSLRLKQGENKKNSHSLLAHLTQHSSPLCIAHCSDTIVEPTVVFSDFSLGFFNLRPCKPPFCILLCMLNSAYSK